MINKTIFAILLFGLSCTSVKRAPKTDSIAQVPQVLTVLLELSQGDKGAPQFKISNIIRADGHVKDYPIAQANFEFRFISKEGDLMTLVQQRIELISTVEFINEDGILEKKRIKEPNKIVVVRTSDDPSTSSMQIFSLPDRKLITTLPIKTINK